VLFLTTPLVDWTLSTGTCPVAPLVRLSSGILKAGRFVQPMCKIEAEIVKF
jgi:hypothetical protein